METFRIVKVIVSLSDGTRWLDCEIYLPTGSRLSDVMNDERKFLPIKREGKEIVVHKDKVVFLTES
jgi:hypothetical protein